MPENRIRVMIVDDHAIVREGIAEVLGHSEGFEVVGQAGDGQEAPLWSERSCPMW